MEIQKVVHPSRLVHRRFDTDVRWQGASVVQLGLEPSCVCDLTHDNSGDNNEDAAYLGRPRDEDCHVAPPVAKKGPGQVAHCSLVEVCNLGGLSGV
jgi:hypothetical protein